MKPQSSLRFGIPLDKRGIGEHHSFSMRISIRIGDSVYAAQVELCVTRVGRVGVGKDKGGEIPSSCEVIGKCSQVNQ